MTDLDPILEQASKEFLAHHGVLGMKWGHRKDGGSVTKAKSSSTDVRKMKRSDLDKSNPTHRAEITRRNVRNVKLALVGVAALDAGVKIAGQVQVDRYLKSSGAQATTKIADSKAIHDGSVYALHMMSNGSFG